MQYKHVEGSVEPKALDENSSKNWVFIRKNIEFIKGTDEENPDHWEYDELLVSKDSYPAFLMAQGAIDYVNAMEDLTNV